MVAILYFRGQVGNELEKNIDFAVFSSRRVSGQMGNQK